MQNAKKNNTHLKNRIFYLIFLFSVPFSVDKSYGIEQDTTYYTTYHHQLTGRFLFSQKFTSVKFSDKADNHRIHYFPNTTLNMGVGATYRRLNLNLAYGFGFLNQNQERGNTKYLDLQVHAHPQKFNVDLFAQFYKGYYATNNNIDQSDNKYYLRPDLSVRKIGGNIQYIFNHHKFSLRAPNFHNEWQKKSAGSLLLGFETYFGQVSADSAFLPSSLTGSPRLISQGMRFIEAGSNIGYAYTLVIKKHFYVSASASAGITFGVKSIEENGLSNSETGLNLNALSRIFVGYNSETWAVGMGYVDNRIMFTSENIDLSTRITTGNIRLNFIKRFTPGPKLQRRLNVIDIIIP
ncbi:MAG: DUF4421 domain-containing protein [Cyclobacteriaceae bacterium]